MTFSKALFFTLLSFIGGVLLSSFFPVPKIIIYELFILGGGYFLLAVFSSGKTEKQKDFKKLILVFSLCLVFLCLGIIRADSAGARLAGSAFEKKQTTGSKIEKAFEPLKTKLRTVVFENFSPPYSSILAALTLGDKAHIPDEWKEKLNRSGTRHITAVSGMHIIILSCVFLWFGLIIGFSRPAAFWFSLAALWFFVALIGFPSSAMRAAIMGSLLIFAQNLGRISGGERPLVLTAAVMLAINPFLLRGDIGFQLSFLAVLGIIYFGGPIKRFLDKNGILKSFGISYLLATALSAQAFVLPILISNFGEASLVSPFSNILIVPVLSFVMILGFLFLLAGLFFSPLASFFALPLRLVLGYMAAVIGFFAGLPFSFVKIKLSWLIIPGYYFLVFIFAFCYNKLLKKRHYVQ